MKKYFISLLFFFILLLSVVPSFLNAKTLTKTNSMPLAQFKELSVVGNKNTSVMFVQNEQYTIEMKGCALNAMRIEQNDTSLFVSTMGLDTIQPIEIIVSAPSFPKVRCHFIKMLSNADTLHMPNILLSAYYSNIEMCVNADYFYLNFVSGTSAKLSGVCKEMNLKCDGYANGKNYTFDAQKLYIQNLQSACGVLSEMYLSVSDSLWLTSGIDCRIDVTGMPVVMENKLNYSQLLMHE